MPEFKERHVYLFKCKSCKKEKRWSFKRRLAKAKICRSCRSHHPINPDQLPLFGDEVTINGTTFKFQEADTDKNSILTPIK